MKETTKSLYTLTLTEVDKFDLDQCVAYLNLLVEKTAKWKRLEEALITRREKVMSEHTTDEEGGWFQKKERDVFCRIWRRRAGYGNREVYDLIIFRKEDEYLTRNHSSHFVLNPLDGGKPVLVDGNTLAGCSYSLQLNDAEIQKQNAKDRSTFYDQWEKTTPFILVVKYGADHIELARDHWDSILMAMETNRNFRVVRHENVWYIIGNISY